MSEETKETKVCKYCQTEIPKKAKVCPNCRKKQKHTGCGTVLFIIGVLIFLIAFISMMSGGSSDSSSSSVSSSEKTDSVLQAGDSFEANGLKITVDETDANYTDYEDTYGLYTLNDGMKYVKASFTFENTANSDVYVSIYDFNCYADNATCDQQYGLDDSDFINTNLSSGRNVSFNVYFAVPENAESIELEYETNIWTSKKQIIKIQ